MHKQILAVLAAFFIVLASCKKQKIVETVTVVDTVYSEIHDTTLVPALISDTTTTLIILRHVEKEATGTDPNIDSLGLIRADELKRILANTQVDVIYSTPYNRTRQSVQPLATAKGLTIIDYSATLPYEDLVGQVLAAGRGKVSVIVGHSNTVPAILKEVSNDLFNITISETQYDDLFIVSMPDSLTPDILHLKYGIPTP